MEHTRHMERLHDLRVAKDKDLFENLKDANDHPLSEDLAKQLKKRNIVKRMVLRTHFVRPGVKELGKEFEKEQAVRTQESLLNLTERRQSQPYNPAATATLLFKKNNSNVDMENLDSKLPEIQKKISARMFQDYIGPASGTKLKGQNDSIDQKTKREEESTQGLIQDFELTGGPAKNNSVQAFAGQQSANNSSFKFRSQSTGRLERPAQTSSKFHEISEFLKLQREIEAYEAVKPLHADNPQEKRSLRIIRPRKITSQRQARKEIVKVPRNTMKGSASMTQFREYIYRFCCLCLTFSHRPGDHSPHRYDSEVSILKGKGYESPPPEKNKINEAALPYENEGIRRAWLPSHTKNFFQRYTEVKDADEETKQLLRARNNGSFSHSLSHGERTIRYRGHQHDRGDFYSGVTYRPSEHGPAVLNLEFDDSKRYDSLRVGLQQLAGTNT